MAKVQPSMEKKRKAEEETMFGWTSLAGANWVWSAASMLTVLLFGCPASFKVVYSLYSLFSSRNECVSLGLISK